MSLSIKDVAKTLVLCQFPGYSWHLQVDLVDSRRHLFLYASFKALDATTGKPDTQTTRRWLLSANMTNSDVVRTAFKCVLTSVEHEARECFKYRQHAVFGPHIDVDSLVEFCAMAARVRAS